MENDPTAQLRSLLYECIVELKNVQNHIGLDAATEHGRDLIERGMKLLGVTDLSKEVMPRKGVQGNEPGIVSGS